MKNFYELAQQLGTKLLEKKYSIAVAESCTGGQLAYYITLVPGSSAYFERGFVTYSNAAKSEMLGIAPDIIKHYSAVSSQTAIAMAEGALIHSRADVTLSITGIAGPEGGSEGKPVGTLYIAFASKTAASKVERFLFQGDRKQIRDQAAFTALTYLLENL